VTDYFVEIRAAVRRMGPPRLVPLADVDRHFGFRSVFCYDTDTAQSIAEAGNTANLRACEVYADTVFMDFDGHEPTAFRAWLAGSGLTYTEWDSGNRSVHYHIPIAPIFGYWVPAAVKAWTQKHAPTADISFLHPAGMYRLPGTYHAKNPGRRKELVAQQDGDTLVLAPPPPTALRPLAFSDGESTTEDFYILLSQVKGEGHRSGHLWRMATVASEAGIAFDVALERMQWWNDRMAATPHDSTKVLRQCESAYRRKARS